MVAMFQSPPNMLGFLICASTALTALIAMALSAATCDRSWCWLVSPSQPASAAALGVASGVIGMLVAGAACAWYVVTAFWDVGVARYVLVAGFLIVSVLSLVDGIIYAYALNLPNGTSTFASYFHTAVAACVWQWFLFVLSAAGGFFCSITCGNATELSAIAGLTNVASGVMS